MNFNLSTPRYTSDIRYPHNTTVQETFIFEAVLNPPYELVAAGHGSLRFGKVMFHRMSQSQEPNGQFSYLESQIESEERSENGTYQCDLPVNEHIFDRWMMSGIYSQQLSLVVSFGFMPPAGLKNGAGPDGWEIKTWFVETHRDLLVTEFSLIVQPATLRSTNAY